METREYVRRTVVDRFYEVARLYPDRVAIVCSAGSISYGELERQSNHLANRLRAHGVGRDCVVALYLERSIGLVIAIFGVLKAGGAYLPLRPGDPIERNQLILTDSGARCLVRAGPWASMPDFAGTTLTLDEGADSDTEYDGPPPHPDDLAYVIYTSGSTGRPKGVAIEHRALENRLRWMQKAYPISPADRLLQKTVHTFDVSVWELLWWGLEGASVVLLDSGRERDPRAIARTISKHGVSVVHFVPSMLTLFLEYVSSGERSAWHTLRWVFASGEKLMAETVRLFYCQSAQQPAVLLVNLYGPTEAAIDVTHHACARDYGYEDVPIGTAIDQIRCYVLDEGLNDIPDGERGQLYLAGIGLARGYHNNPELTRRCFFDHPRIPGERLYKTSDIVYRDAVTGEIHYVGRADSQIKLRGLRVELGEIDYHLRGCNGVRDAFVFSDVLPPTGQHILALVSVGNAFSAEATWARLTAALPDYMLPSRLLVVDELPRLSNGKVNRVEARTMARNAQGRTNDLRASTV